MTVFAYGATGAGKTHTMMGNSRRDATTMDDSGSLGGGGEVNGIIPQALVDLYQVNFDERPSVHLSPNTNTHPPTHTMNDHPFTCHRTRIPIPTHRPTTTPFFHSLVLIFFKPSFFMPKPRAWVMG